MNTLLEKFIKQYRSPIEEHLLKNLPLSCQQGASRYNDALHYAIFPGGKRWRPLLTLLGGNVIGASLTSLFATACAIEYLHTSSMIIDDLPAMDDADIRRGKPVMHLAYDESLAMLVSLALMNHSYLLLAKTCALANHQDKTGQLIMQATACIGANGMIGGQVVDLELLRDATGGDTLESRNLKTTALMRLVMTAGAISSNACVEDIDVLAKYGEALGTTYQIYDDLLDVLGESRAIGKTSKQDQRHFRPSYVSEYGISQAQKIAIETLDEGSHLLRLHFGLTPGVSMLLEAGQLIISANKISHVSNLHELVTTH